MRTINENNEHLLLEEFFEIFEKKGDKILSPRFKPKNQSHRIFKDYPVGKRLRYDRRLIYDAIKYGMILKMDYETDDAYTTRTIQPMVLGRNKNGEALLRAFHLKGDSDSMGNADKVWRLFKPSRINRIKFTGKFFRTTPDNYKSDDSAMKGGILASADLDEIERNQQEVINSEK